MIVFAAVSAKLVERFGTKRVATAGMLLFSLGLAVAATVGGRRLRPARRRARADGRGHGPRRRAGDRVDHGLASARPRQHRLRGQRHDPRARRRARRRRSSAASCPRSTRGLGRAPERRSSASPCRAARPAEAAREAFVARDVTGVDRRRGRGRARRRRSPGATCRRAQACRTRRLSPRRGPDKPGRRSDSASSSMEFSAPVPVVNG